MDAKFPNHAHREEVDAFKQQLDDARATTNIDQTVSSHRQIAEAHWFFEAALRHRRRGDDAEARRLLEALIDAYRDTPSQRRWVRLAEQELDLRPPLRGTPKTARVLQETIDRARRLEKEGNADEAKSIRRGLRELYRDDKPALEAIGRE